MSAADPKASELGLRFTKTLAARDYAAAHAMLTDACRRRIPLATMQAEYERMIPLGWGSTDPIEVVTTMGDWPSRAPGDLGWVYVSIGGDTYSEAVTLVVTDDNGTPRIRDIEWGRP